MAFVKAQIEIKPASVGTGIKVALRAGRGVHAKMAISVTGPTIKDLDWRDGDKIEVLIGEGEHHGLMRVRKNNSAGQAVVAEKAAVRGGSYLHVALGHQPAFVDRTETALWVRWERVEEGWIEIVLPKWADETASRKAAPPAPKAPYSSPSVAAAREAPKRGQSVTAQLMGDPPPGRKEMLDKIGKISA